MKILASLMLLAVALWLTARGVIGTPALARDEPATESGEGAQLLVGPGESIQQAIDGLPAEGGTVVLAAGEHWLTAGLWVNRSGMTLRGEAGARLRLADGVNQPVILLGDDAEVPGAVIRNLRVEGLEIDGNRKGQDSETDPTRPWIRNNGLDVRRVEGLVVDRVRVRGARSGGLVVSWDSRDIEVMRCSFDDNEFDGIALYASERILVRDFECRDNQAAGLSFDNDLRRVRFEAGTLANNGDVGVFARHSSAIDFVGVEVTHSGSHGVFLSHREPGEGSGVRHFRLIDCRIAGSGGFGLWLASPASESPDNGLCRVSFADNAMSDIHLAPAAVLKEWDEVW